MASRRHTDDALLDAARDCVASVGVRRTSVADVARRAGASRMTVYRVFPDAGTLWSTLLTRELGELLTQAESEAAPLPTARERLVAATTLAVRRIAADEVVRRVIDLDPDLLLPYLTERLGASQRIAMTQFQRYIAAGHADGSIRAVDAAAASYLLQMLVSTVVVASRVSEREASLASVIHELGVMIDAYLAPPAKAA